MPHHDLELETPVSPERVFAVLTAGSRPWSDTALWPWSTRPGYRVYYLGDHDAELEERTLFRQHRVRYHWSEEQGLLRATLLDASGIEPGSSWDVRVTPRPGGGSVVRLYRDARFRWTLPGILARLRTVRGERRVRRWLRQTVSSAEDEGCQLPR
jgi:hypothetical protein